MLELEASKSQMTENVSPMAGNRVRYGNSISHINHQLEQSDERALVNLDE